MRRAILIAILLCLGAVPLTVNASSARAPVPPPSSLPAAADTYVDAGIPDSNNNTYELQTATAGVCDGTNNTSTIYLRWDVSAWQSVTVNTAEMKLEMYYNSNGGPGPVKLSLYKVADDTWDETKMVYSNPPPSGFTAPPAVGDLIQTIDLADPNQATGPVTFGSASAPSALADYITTQKVAGDGLASFALNVTGCPGNNAGIYIVLYDKDLPPPIGSASSSPSAAPSADTPPTLNLAAPTAVTMSTFRAADPAVSWPLVAGVGALAAILIGGLAVARRRAATH